MKYIIILILATGVAFSQDIESILGSSDTDSVKVIKLNSIGRNSQIDNNIRDRALDSAFTLSHNSIFHYGKAATYLSKAHLALDRDSVVKALDYFTLSIIGFGDLKLPKESAEAQFKLARTYQSIGMLEKANQTYHYLLKTYDKVGTKAGHVFLQLANNYKELGKEDSAQIYSSKLKGSDIQTIDFSHTFNDIQKEKVENEIAKRELQNEVEKAKFRTDVIAFLLGVLLAIAVLIIIYLIFRVRSLNKKLGIENKED